MQYHNGTIVICRQAGDAAWLIAALKAKGQKAVSCPLASQRLVPPAQIKLPLNPSDIGGLLFSSAKAVSAFTKLARQWRGQLDRDIPLFCVGPATADAAKQLGFAKLHLPAKGAAGLDALLPVIRAEKAALNGKALLHPGAKILARAVDAPLQQAGIAYHHLPIYDSYYKDKLPPKLQELWQNDGLKLVMLFSPAAATCFASLTENLALPAHLQGVWCLSKAVAAPLHSRYDKTNRGGQISDRSVIWPDAQDRDAILASLDYFIK